jgi:chromosome segregation ATPase
MNAETIPQDNPETETLADKPLSYDDFRLPGSPGFIDRVSLGVEKRAKGFSAWAHTFADRESAKRNMAHATEIETRIQHLKENLREEKARLRDLKGDLRDLKHNDSGLAGIARKTSIGSWVQGKRASAISENISNCAAKISAIEAAIISRGKDMETALARKTYFDEQINRKVAEIVAPLQEKIAPVEAGMNKVNGLVKKLGSDIIKFEEVLETNLAEAAKLDAQLRYEELEPEAEKAHEERLEKLRDKISKTRSSLNEQRKLYDKCTSHQSRLERAHRSVAGGHESLRARYSRIVAEVAKPKITEAGQVSQAPETPTTSEAAVNNHSETPSTRPITSPVEPEVTVISQQRVENLGRFIPGTIHEVSQSIAPKKSMLRRFFEFLLLGRRQKGPTQP